MIDYRLFEEFMKMNESVSCFKGHCRIIEKDTGNVLVDKDNLILLRTRLYVMKALFGVGDDVEAANKYIHNDNRKICLFKIGSGGADVSSTPFQPFSPKYNDTDLKSPVSFIHVTDMKDSDPDFESNPSYLKNEEFLILENNQMYHKTANSKQTSNITSYDAKAFNHSEVIFDKENNTLYADLDLEISDYEARGAFINELGLLLAEEYYELINDEDLKRGYSKELTVADYNDDKKTSKEARALYKKAWKDEELATRITFDTISLQSLARALVIEYRIYA